VSAIPSPADRFIGARTRRRLSRTLVQLVIRVGAATAMLPPAFSSVRTASPRRFGSGDRRRSHIVPLDGYHRGQCDRDANDDTMCANSCCPGRIRPLQRRLIFPSRRSAVDAQCCRPINAVSDTDRGSGLSSENGRSLINRRSARRVARPVPGEPRQGAFFTPKASCTRTTKAMVGHATRPFSRLFVDAQSAAATATFDHGLRSK
jgi:hypothetical protein